MHADSICCAHAMMLFSHQAAAVEALLRGRHVALSTPTGSGKSLAYNVPVLHAMLADGDARALYLFPTKAHEQPLFLIWLALSHVGMASSPPPFLIWQGAGARPAARAAGPPIEPRLASEAPKGLTRGVPLCRACAVARRSSSACTLRRTTATRRSPSARGCVRRRVAQRSIAWGRGSSFVAMRCCALLLC